MGADAVVNYKTTPDWDKPARDFTGGSGGSRRRGGRRGNPAAHQGRSARGTYRADRGSDRRGRVGSASDHDEAVRLQGIYVGSREMFEDMNRAIAVAGMRPVLDRVFPFAETVTAMRYLESGAHFGKIGIRFLIAWSGQPIS